MNSSTERVLGALRLATGDVRDNGRQYKARCPAHADRDPSLSITPIDGSVLLYCHAGCQVDDVLASLSLTRADLFDEPRGATYRYDSGRIVHRTPDKKFRQSGDLSTVELYHLSRLQAAGPGTVFLVEGEKDVHAIESLDGIATTAPMGSRNFAKVDVGPLRGRHVTAIRDQDDAGERWAVDVQTKLAGVVAGLRFAEAATGKDAADHVAAGHGLDDFVVVEAPALDVPDAPTEEPRRIKLTAASEIRIRPVRWVWQDRMPAGVITLIPGREGIGKSLTLAWLTAQLTRGTLPGIYYGDPRPVFYAASEDSWEHTIAPRLLVAGADLTQVYRVEVESIDSGSTMPLTLPRDCDQLAAEVKRLGVALLALDPLMSVVSASIDTHRDRDLRTALEPLAALADAADCAVGGLAHFNKSASTDVSNLITGSRAFSAVARSVIAIARDPDSETGECVISQTKNNLGRLDLPSLKYVVEPVTVETPEGEANVGRLTFTGKSDRSVSDILGAGPPLNEDERSERDEAADWLTGYLAKHGGEAPRADVMKAGRADGFSESTINRARRKAGVTADRKGFAGGSTWKLPDGDAP